MRPAGQSQQYDDPRIGMNCARGHSVHLVEKLGLGFRVKGLGMRV